jgi:cell fate (sporulation/competence/biofilm development) regulator YlbF (YheA/YmcA/DUF963 family)
MYSISSQIFEGITESLMSYQGATTEKEEEQKGPIASGRVMADILKSESGTQKKKYLHDYSYILFEDYLKKSDKILSLSAESIDENIGQIDDAGFVEVRAKVIFNDMNMIKSTIENFNQLGKALTHITNFAKIEEVYQQLKKAGEAIKDRNQKARFRQRQKALTNVEKMAKEQGLNLNKDFLEDLNFVLNYGFQEQFIVQMPIGPYTFSADCKRDDLLENEDSLIRKHSRFSEKEFVLVGTVAQSSRESVNSEDDNDVPQEPGHMKEAIMNMVEVLFTIESSFSGKLANEIIVDPIAIYREV